MALMMDNKPTEYKGEALVWEKLSSLLPNDVVVYNHREVVDDREFDFALLIKNVGIMVIEVKGWQSQYIFDVKGPDEIVIQGDSKIYGSPEKQARGYRFDWLNLLNDKFAISPVVLSMVCYPFISEKEYKDVRLDIVSSRDFTIFSDDLNSATKLGQKISNAFVKKKPLNSTPFDEKAMAIVRQHFEPSYKAKDDQIVEVSDAYSLLKVFNKELTEKDSDELIEMYFAGTKIVAFVKSEIDLLSVCNKLEAGFNARGIISDKGNVRLAEIDERNDFNGSGLLEVDIEDDKDVYNQKNVFKTAYATIDAILSENDRFKEFKDKLQNSTLLVLIKDIDSTNSDAVEQIFLDINEKSKRLDNASIFKGYCFKIYDEAFQDELKCLWIRLKKAYISFKNFSGENYKFDEYIYMYLLVTEDENMTENLSPGGIHFLEDKNMDDVERILTKMVEYGERVSDFYKHIQNEAYIFEDICVDSNSYKTASKKLITNVKEYLLYSMETKSAQYQKVPLNWFIYSVKDKSNNMNILMKDFMTITANLYIYSFLFTLSPSKKSKKNIDHSLYNVLNEDVDIKQIINIVKELRKKQVENVQIPENCRSFDVLSNLYTIMDCFKVKENRFDVTYHNHGGQLYTLEHFIVPDNRNAKIKWLTKDEESIEISFTGQSERKKKLINYLIVEQKLNNDILLDFDVIKKIELISDYYGNATPKHVGIITAHIENMESYKELKKLKNEEDEKEVENIRNCYNSFLDEYFSDNNQRTILNKLLEGLKLTFINS